MLKEKISEILQFILSQNVKHFKYDELVVTQAPFVNDVECVEHACNLIKLVYFLDVVRDLINLPIHTNSCYRTKQVNDYVHGSPGSYHLSGRAADIRCSDLNLLYKTLNNFKKKGIIKELIKYKTFIHFAI